MNPRNLTPKQRIGAAVLACCTLAGGYVAQFEGTRFHTYPDPVTGWKAPTVCTGHMDPALPRDATFTQAECDQMLHSDLTGTYKALAADSCIGNVPMPDNELAAFLSLSFNIGSGAFCRGSIPKLLQTGDHGSACDFVTRYRMAGGKDCAIASNNCAGIYRRRLAEKNLCLGVTPS